ncbi:Early growth response protein 1 [Cytospora mali]|uniref:Early growth response protein 1 n=1 Tax=Cytospora mali TaxID=578113 RepID=A0A194VT54_CYTMA|nr:Early growth response protein 1 [Valsa mali]
MHELQAILSIEPMEKYMDYGEKKLRVHITECCGSLVQMVGNNRVELVHHTAREFVVKNEHVNEYAVQCDMTVLCLQYLTFDCFNMELKELEVAKNIREGLLSFQDYSVSKWFHHLETLIEKCGPFLSEEVGRDAQHNLFEALDEFTMFYQEGLRLKDTYVEKLKRDAAEDCKVYESLPLFEHLRDIWAHVRMHQQTLDIKERDKIGIPELLEAVKRNRKAVEAIAAEKTDLSKLEVYYGRNHFKCTRLTCPYFYEGFEVQNDRDKHLKRHDRPFQCVIETCDQKCFGFTSNKELEKHMRTYHPETCDTNSPEFQFAALNQRRIEQTKFVCPICQKNFTRNVSVKGHLDSHNGLKSFACPECGKGFARKNDMVRHQKIHNKSHRGG